MFLLIIPLDISHQHSVLCRLCPNYSANLHVSSEILGRDVDDVIIERLWETLLHPYFCNIEGFSSLHVNEVNLTEVLEAVSKK